MRKLLLLILGITAVATQAAIGKPATMGHSISCPNLPPGTYVHNTQIHGWLFEFSAYTPEHPTLELPKGLHWQKQPDYTTFSYIVGPTTTTKYAPICMYMMGPYQSVGLYYVNHGPFRCTEASDVKNPNFKYCSSNSFTQR